MLQNRLYVYGSRFTVALETNDPFPRLVNLPYGSIAQSGGDNINRHALRSRRKLQTVDHVFTGHKTNKPAIHSPQFHDTSVVNSVLLWVAVY